MAREKKCQRHNNQAVGGSSSWASPHSRGRMAGHEAASPKGADVEAVRGGEVCEKAAGPSRHVSDVVLEEKKAKGAMQDATRGATRGAARGETGAATGDRPAGDGSRPSRECSGILKGVRENRWVALGLVCLLTAADHVVWVSFSPITKASTAYYGVNKTAIVMLSLLYIIIFIVSALVVGVRIDTNGLRSGVVWGAVLNCIGAVINVIPAPFKLSGVVGYVFNLLGHIVGGVAHSFILVVPTKLAQVWFPRTERTMALALCLVAGQVGATIGLFLSPFIANTETISLLLLMFLFGSVVILVAILIFFADAPTTPPSHSVVYSVGSSPSLFEMSRTLARMDGFVFTALAYGIVLGSYYAIWVLLSLHNVMQQYEFLSTSGTIIYNCVGLLGAITGGALVDRNVASHRTLSLTFLYCFAVSLFIFSVSLTARNLAAIGLSCALMGFFILALLTVLLDFIMEISFPAPQSTTSAIVLLFGQACALAAILLNAELQRHDFAVSSWLISIIVFCAVPLLSLAKNQKCRRRLYEDAVRARRRASGPGAAGLRLGPGAALAGRNFFALESTGENARSSGQLESQDDKVYRSRAQLDAKASSVSEPARGSLSRSATSSVARPAPADRDAQAEESEQHVELKDLGPPKPTQAATAL